MERTLEQRVDALDWDALSGALLEDGFAVIERLLTDAECDALKALYGEDALFRSTVDMGRFNFGSGQYRYFKYPLPAPVQLLRETIYGRIVPAANAWSSRLRQGVEYPPRFPAFQEAMRARGQTKPTPLLLRYGKGDFNNLHQDVVGDLVFPYQVTFGLCGKGTDYQGGQLILTQQRPRMQTVPHVITIPKGGGVLFASNLHAQQGKKGFYRTVFRHGVSRIEEGSRYTLGIVFHDFRA
jgi:hypothetical protein